MCASPGSKTTQLVEFIHSGLGADVRGGVVANELDFKRAWVLSHQIKRLNTPCVAILNHPGQFLPTLKKNQENVKFDKALVDVPCSGDGALRKLPGRWKNWKATDGLDIHPLQIQLLIRAINLTKEGGLVVYSTCSLNAIENEAVIAEVLRLGNLNIKGSLELIDVHGKLDGLKMRRGLSYWKMLVTKDDVVEKKDGENLKKVKRTFGVFDSFEHFEKEKQNIFKKYIKKIKSKLKRIYVCFGEICNGKGYQNPAFG